MVFILRSIKTFLIFRSRWILIAGMFLWSAVSLIATFMETFAALLAMRCLIGIGEACYSAVATGIISDLYAKDQRTKFLALYFFNVPVGR